MFLPVPAARHRCRNVSGAACRCGPGGLRCRASRACGGHGATPAAGGVRGPWWPNPRGHVPFLRLSFMAAARHEKRPGAPAVRPAMHAMRDARLSCPAKVIEVEERPVGTGRWEYFRSGGQGLAGRSGHGAFGTRGGKGHGSRNRFPARVGVVLRRTKGGIGRGGHGGPRCGTVFGAGGHAVPVYDVGGQDMALPCLPWCRALPCVMAASCGAWRRAAAAHPESGAANMRSATRRDGSENRRDRGGRQA